MNGVRVGAVSGALMVGCGAFGAHALKNQLTPEALGVWQTGVLYHGFHALALIACGILAQMGHTKVGAAAWSFSAGTVLFSGSLYGLALGAPTWLGMVTPIGGLLFIVGWVLLALSRR